MRKPNEKQVSELLAYRWRSEDMAKLAEQAEAEGKPPPPKPKRKRKAKLTEAESNAIKHTVRLARNPGVWGDYFTSDRGDTEVEIVDSEFQKLDFRVGPVYKGDKIAKIPGIWIAYQEKNYLSPRMGDFLMSPSTFFELVEDTLDKIASFQPGDYRVLRRKLAKAKKARRTRR